MRLTAHLHSLERNNVENDAIGGEEHVQVALEIFLLQRVGKVAYV